MAFSNVLDLTKAAFHSNAKYNRQLNVIRLQQFALYKYGHIIDRFSLIKTFKKNTHFFKIIATLFLSGSSLHKQPFGLYQFSVHMSRTIIADPAD